MNFTCEALGIPKPAITWFKDGRRMPKEIIKQTEALSMLTIDSVEPQDQGQYWCEANSNEGWNRSDVANLTGEKCIFKCMLFEICRLNVAILMASCQTHNA